MSLQNYTGISCAGNSNSNSNSKSLSNSLSISNTATRSFNFNFDFNAARLRQRGRCLAKLASSASSVTAVLALHFLLSGTAGAASICQWVDDTGQVQFSDVVPSRYSSVVTCTHTDAAGVPDEQRAADAKAREKAKASEKPKTERGNKPASGAGTSESPALPQSAPVLSASKKPAEKVTDKTDCKTWQRLFDESGACFGPFRTALGGIKAEAFAVCNEVPNPEAKCGPPTN